MKTSFAWLPALFLIAAAVCAGESPAPEKPDADAKAKAEEQALQKRVEEVLKVFDSKDEKSIKELQEKLAKEGKTALPILEMATDQAEIKLDLKSNLYTAKKAIYKAHPALAFKISLFNPQEPIAVLPSDTGPLEITRENNHLVWGFRMVEFPNMGEIPIVIARPQDGSSSRQEYPYYQLQILDQDGKDVSRDFTYDPRKDPTFSISDFLILNSTEYWGKMIYIDWPRPPKPGKYKMRLRYVMPKAEHKCADEAAKKLAEEASIGEVFSNTVDIEFVFPSKEELKKMGVIQDEKDAKEEMKKKDEK